MSSRFVSRGILDTGNPDITASATTAINDIGIGVELEQPSTLPNFSEGQETKDKEKLEVKGEKKLPRDALEEFESYDYNFVEAVSDSSSPERFEEEDPKQVSSGVAAIYHKRKVESYREDIGWGEQQQWQDKKEEEAEKREENAWKIVQRELEEQRRQKAEEKANADKQRARAAAGAGGQDEMSLFAILQANKAAKQTAFEEAHSIKNQFRALDDDEIDFLDGVRESQRKEEEQRQREEKERLNAFHEMKRQATARGEECSNDSKFMSSEWDNLGMKKRKRGGEGGAGAGAVRLGLGLLKKARPEGIGKGEGEHKGDEGKKMAQMEQLPGKQEKKGGASAPIPTPLASTKIGLVDYGSDESD